MQTYTENIKKMAVAQALNDVKYEPTIIKIYWFPHESRIHIIDVDAQAFPLRSNNVSPFYFNPTESIPYVTGIALIHPNDDNPSIVLPPDWETSWDKAVVIFDRANNIIPGV